MAELSQLDVGAGLVRPTPSAGAATKHSHSHQPQVRTSSDREDYRVLFHKIYVLAPQILIPEIRKALKALVYNVVVNGHFV